LAAQARAELAQARPKVEEQFDKMPIGAAGYWFDWVFAGILLREATALASESKG
jgi:hypothetical protein